MDTANVVTTHRQVAIVPSRTLQFLQLTLRDAEGPLLEIRYHLMPLKERSAMPQFGPVAAFVRQLPRILGDPRCAPPDFRQFLTALSKPISFKKRIEMIPMRENLSSGLPNAWLCPNWILFELREHWREYENLDARSAAKVLNRRLGTALTGRQLAKKEYDLGLPPHKIPSEREYKKVRFDRRDPIKLSPQERRELYALKEQKGQPKQVSRITTILMCASGTSLREIAARIGVSRPTVHKWIKAWRAFGMESLHPRTQIRRASITNTDLLVAQNCLKMLKAVGVDIPLETACWDYAEALRLLFSTASIANPTHHTRLRG